jgi:toxin FitB
VKGWLLDTNVISELRKQRADPNVRRFVAIQPASQLFVSDITIAEIVYGIEQVQEMPYRLELRQWLETKVRPVFANRILPVSEDVIIRWKHMIAMGQRKNHTFGQPDLFIAAQAALFGLVVVSRDVSQFVASDVPIFDPWKSEYHDPGKGVVFLEATPLLKDLRTD